MQKDIVNQLNKEFSEEEVKKIYNDARKKAGQGPEYKVDDQVIYLLKNKKREDWDKLTDDQKKAPKEKLASDVETQTRITKLVAEMRKDLFDISCKNTTEVPAAKSLVQEAYGW